MFFYLYRKNVIIIWYVYIFYIVIYDGFFDLSGMEIGIEVSIDVEEFEESIDGFVLVRIKLFIL